MTTGPTKSITWRDRAEAYRQFAAEARSDDGRRACLTVAENCDQIAGRLEVDEAAEAARAAGSAGDS